MSITTHLEVARRDAGLTQHQLAAAAGVARSTVALIENGGARPNVATLGKLSAALALDPTVESYLPLPDLAHDAILGPEIRRIGMLLSWLPVDEPSNPLWADLGRVGNALAADYVHGKLNYVAQACLRDKFDERPEVGTVAELRYVLFLLSPTPETVEAISGHIRPEIAARYLEDLHQSAWAIWTRYETEAPD